MMSAVRVPRVRRVGRILSGFWLVVLLAAGAFVALYALWLNDRRRRTEEERREIERSQHAVQVQRTELDRERAADERFARAVDLLGNDADQVRVGAMHALAGLARDQPRYT